MRSIEIVFDEESEAAVRDRWAALVQAGLPSLALHTAPTNRPHITLAAGPELSLASAPIEPPASVRFGGLTLFPAHGDRWVFVDAVVLDPQLAEFHARLHTALDGALDTTLPGNWSPHVTLSRRLTSERVALALEALRATPLPDAAVVSGVRLWDGETKQVTSLT